MTASSVTTLAADPAGDLPRMAEQAKHASDFLKALAHENRLMILCILACGERSVTELERMLSLRQPTVSQQLARLRTDGLVTARRSGKAIYYRLASDQARVIVDAIVGVFCGGRSQTSLPPGIGSGVGSGSIEQA